MTVLLIALLCLCCAPASALSWGRVADKAKQVFDNARQAAKEAQPIKAAGFTGGPKSADPATATPTATTTVYDLLEDLYYLDDSVADLWQNVKLALIVGAVVMALFLMLQIVTLSLLSTIRVSLNSLRQLAEKAKKRQ